MRINLRTRGVKLLLIIPLVFFIAVCSVSCNYQIMNIVKVTQIVPITQISQVTQVVEITKIIPVTQVVQTTKVVKVTQIVPGTQAVDIPTPALDGRIYFSAGDNLYRMGLDGGGLETVSTGLGLSERLAVDIPHNKLYISRWDAPAQILVVDLQSSKNVEIFRDGPGSGGQGLAIDPGTSMMYLGLYYSGVYGMDMGSAGRWTQLVDSASLSPLLGQRGQLQIDPANRHIYFRSTYDGDCGLCRYIWRVDFDGGNLNQIIQANGGDALALDLSEGKLYFSDIPGNGTIMRANMDGSDLETVFSVPPPYQFCRTIALDVAHQRIYLSLFDEGNDYKGRAIARVNMDGTEFEVLYEATGNTGDEVRGGMALYLPE
jgi:hypothetical protein